ncbi:MAG: porin [Alistipes sp.]|nr:porin [Alistipes sp.]
MKKLLFTLLATTLFCTSLSAQEMTKNPINIQAEVRFDYQGDYVDGEAINSNTGFKGKYLNIILSGNISKSFSYSYRQRLNKAHANQSFFDATDWVYLTYTTPNQHWSFSGGKQVVGIGGYEYDRAPIDLYFCSEYWNNIACYQFGVSATYATTDGRDKIMAQVCQSPFRAADAKNMFAYNLMWYGSHNWFNSIYSLNMMEYMPGEFVYYVTLGNEFLFGRNAKLQLDVMNRAVEGHSFLFKDFSVMGEFAYNIKDRVNLFAKATYDVNNSDVAGDMCVLPGTDITRVGAGLEFYPLKNSRSVRLHATYCHTFGENGNPAGALLPEQQLFSVGLKWKIDIVSLTKKIVK